MNTITLYIGLDVHKDSIIIAIAEAGSKSEIRLFGTITNDLHALESQHPQDKGQNRFVVPRAGGEGSTLRIRTALG